MTHKREITRVGCSKQNYQQLLPTHNTTTDLEPTANDWPKNNLKTENVFEFRSLDIFCYSADSRNRFNTSSFDSQQRRHDDSSVSKQNSHNNNNNYYYYYYCYYYYYYYYSYRSLRSRTSRGRSWPRSRSGRTTS